MTIYKIRILKTILEKSKQSQEFPHYSNPKVQIRRVNEDDYQRGRIEFLKRGTGDRWHDPYR